MKAIPTTYAGVRLRSRLEARWGAFFDLAGITWEYEPIDLEGWAPDFLLKTSAADIYAEVKPVELTRRSHPEGWEMPTFDEAEGPFAKARRHWRSVWVLCLGARPQTDADYFGIGSLMDPPEAGGRWWDVKEAISPTNSQDLWKQAGNRVQWRPA